MASVTDGKVLIAPNSTAFCEICQHSVYDMEKHIKSYDHIRQVRRVSGDTSRKPRLPIGVNRAATGAK